ncbi:MAG: adenylate/guanylate cyclase domain-containing protein [Actinomycetota bacterium]|nr:adenylate/guanylate cyclase domain-containing protein [Actinomycetota bacterium]
MATIAVVDIRGFTTFADRSTAREAAAYLTEFFAIAVPVLCEHGGQVNKLLGDGLLTVFGAPVPMPDHADRAIAAATDLLDAVDAALGERCRIGIGVNSGLVLVGTMGAGDVLELAVVGDPVNVASRVQDATRDMGEPLLLTEATRLLLDGSRRDLVSRETIVPRGKSEPIAVYGLAPDSVTLTGRFARRKELT